MNRLQTALLKIAERKASRSPALMCHIVAGFPSFTESIELAVAMVDAGASLLEVQIPFSDPIADGPTIMRANEQALRNGVRTAECLCAVEAIARRVDVPILLMSYLNPLVNYHRNGRLTPPSESLRALIEDAESAGASGIIVPDIPPEETSDGFWDLTAGNKFVAVPLVSPLTTSERMRKIAAVTAESFVYCLSLTGTTGARAALPKDLGPYLRRARSTFKRPLAVGFGISKPEHVRALRGHAEIATVGSAVIDLIERATKPKRKSEIARFVRSLSADAMG